MEPFEMTETFHEVFDPRKPPRPTPFPPEEAAFRAGFKGEELVEFLYGAAGDDPQRFDQLVAQLHQAIDASVVKIKEKNKDRQDPLVEQVDALTDLLYLTYGSFSLLGVDPQPLLEIVHRANMGKLFPDGTPHYDPVTNKVLKPADWEAHYAPEAQLLAALVKQGYRPTK